MRQHVSLNSIAEQHVVILNSNMATHSQPSSSWGTWSKYGADLLSALYRHKLLYSCCSCTKYD